MPTGARGLAIVAILSLAILPGSGQTPALRIVSASPTGELDQLADAGQIRIIFSEPMVALGSVPPGSAPPWIRMTPAVTGSFFWSGTKTLIFSPDGSTPLPFATRFTVRVDGIGDERGRPRARRSVRVHVHDADRPAALG